jgi:hypothetical protein
MIDMQKGKSRKKDKDKNSSLITMSFSLGVNDFRK